MARGLEVLVCLAGVLVLSYGNSTITGSADSFEDVVKEVRKNCFVHRSKECVFFDFLTLLNVVLPSSGYQAHYRGNTSVPDLHNEDYNSNKLRSGISVQTVNHLLAGRMFRKLGGRSLSAIKAFGNSTWQKLRRVMDLHLADDQGVQRGRTFYWWRYIGSLLLTLALVIFSALLSKALTLGALSLLLSLLALLGGLGGLGGGAGGGGHKYSSPPLPAYRSPTTFIAPARHPGVLQYEEEQEDPANPYVYVNRKNWKTARSGDYARFYKYHYEE